MTDIKAGFAEYFDKNLTDEEVQAIFDRVDIDRSGVIDYSEFVVSAMSQ